jgi:thiamine-monophosphate kinase
MTNERSPNWNTMKLSELGEIEILRNIIFPYHKRPDGLPNALGDDCVDLPIRNLRDRIVWTMDPTPLPISWLIGKPDYYTYGWYSVLINLSDIAAMGAYPVGVMLSVIAPIDLRVIEFKKFLKGVEDCCRQHNTYVLGGNIKEGKEFSCVGTALGSINQTNILKRHGCDDGDIVVVIGEMGAFWAAVFSKLQKLVIPKSYKNRLISALNRPIARLKEGQTISKNRYATSCMDNSDSVVSCCYELANQNNLNVILTINEEDLNPYYLEVFKKSGVNPLTASCSWGDWNLICTTPQKLFKELQKSLKSFCKVVKIGYVQKPSSNLESGRAFYLMDDKLKPLNKEICSERFQKQSYFSSGLQNYLEILRNQQLWIN